MRDYKHVYIGGRWVDPSTDKIITVRSPHDNSITGTVPEADTADVDHAVVAARDAFDNGPWPRMRPVERQEILARFAALHAERSQELAELVTAENGSPLWFTRVLHGFIGDQNEAYLRAAATYPWEKQVDGYPGGSTLVRSVPVGVVAAIIPWNAPQQSALVKLFPALLAGCTVILKVSPETAIDGYVLGEIFNQAGLPEGVLSILAADRPVSEYLVQHRGVDKIAFTGSSVAGRRIASLAGADLKRVSLELGGKSACIILDDMKIENVVPALRFASFMNSGQVCIGLTRLLISKKRHNEFVDALVADVEDMTVGDPAIEENFIGPLVAERQRVRVDNYISLGLSEGALAATGGVGMPAGINTGAYVRPTVFTNVSNNMRIAQEEIFGPVVVVLPYDSEEHAIAIANDSLYGLSGGVCGSDVERARNLARGMRTGTVCINGGGPDFLAPAGGFKQSGIGREMGAAGIGPYTELQSIVS